MPLYTFKCDTCGHTEDYVHAIARRDDVCDCPTGRCLGLMQRDVAASMRPHTDLKDFHKPIDMYSIGMQDDDEIKAFKRQAPDVDVSMDPNDEMYGVPVARNRKQKLQALRAAEFQEAN